VGTKRYMAPEVLDERCVLIGSTKKNIFTLTICLLQH